MHQLSGLDASFLHLETPQMPMHVGALHVFELPAGFKGKFVDVLRRHVAARLPLMPALRRRLWWMPLNLANPAWVDAEPDLEQHIVALKLPPSAKRGDGMAELEALVGQLHPVLLNRRLPLWKFHVIEGLGPSAEGRRRVALYSQAHHAAVDGQAAVALANILFDTSPEPRELALRASKRPRTFRLEMAEMLRGALAREALQVGRMIRQMPAAVGSVARAAGAVAANSGLLGGKAAGRVSNLGLAPRTPFNVSVTEGRAFASLSLPLGELRSLAKAQGATLNDLVLMLCATGLRSYYQARKKVLPRKAMVAAVPISLRQAGDTRSDNQASLSFISLGTQIADTGRRLAHIKAASASMKTTMGSLKSVLPTDFPSLGLPWLLGAATALYGKARVADKIPPVANVVISNVPGPPVPVYLAGARMLTNYPTSIVVHGMALNITVQSYHEHMDFGLMADAEAMPDVRLLANAIRGALDQIRALPRPEAAPAEPPKPLAAAKPVSKATKSRAKAPAKSAA
ncbi:MAG TPA: wax ester/triacylglycerol synthase family O-acyltransferase [Ideonella sp.]|nr:wax ester/triacylglycerol synthase family O-acyltransferase [Ideonella sp.]